MVTMIPTGYNPTNELGGFYHGINAATAQAENENQYRRSILENLVKEKEAAVAQQQMQSAPWMQSQIDKDVGAANSAMAAGNIALGTQDTTISSTNEANKTKVIEEQAKAKLAEMQNAYMGMQKLADLSANNSGMAFNFALEKIAPQIGLDPQETQALMQMHPDLRTRFINERLGGLQSMIERTPAILAEFAKERNKEAAKAPMDEKRLANALQIARENNATSRANSAASLKQQQLHFEARNNQEAKLAFQHAQTKYKASQAMFKTQADDLADMEKTLKLRKNYESTPEYKQWVADKAQLKANMAAAEAEFDSYKEQSTGKKEETTPNKPTASFVYNKATGKLESSQKK